MGDGKLACLIADRDCNMVSRLNRQIGERIRVDATRCKADAVEQAESDRLNRRPRTIATIQRHREITRRGQRDEIVACVRIKSLRHLSHRTARHRERLIHINRQQHSRFETLGRLGDLFSQSLTASTTPTGS